MFGAHIRHVPSRRVVPRPLLAGPAAFLLRLVRLRRAKRMAMLAWCIAAFAGLGTIHGVAAENPAAEIRTYEQFWNAGQAGSPTEGMLHARMYVLCYYPSWKTLWVLWDNQVHYLDADSKPLPVTSGEWIDVEARCRPASQTIEWPTAKITPVAGLPAPTPVLLAPDAANADAVSTGYAEIEGLVDTQSDLDQEHEHLNLVFGGTHATVFVRYGKDDKRAQLEGATIRATGVLSVKRGVAGQESGLEFWCASPQAIHVTGFLATDPRFSAPETAIESLHQAGGLVHIAGTVFRQDPGTSVTIRDGTGQALVLTHQLQRMREGSSVEAIGHAVREGVSWVLRDGLVRPRTNGARPQAVRFMLRLADQVRTAAPADITEGLDVRLSGVVTWASPASPYFFFEDATGGVKVFRPKDAAAPVPVVGAGMTIDGVVRPGDFVPVVEARALRPGGNFALREPTRLSLEEAMTGAPYGSLVEMQGYVHSVDRADNGTDWKVTTSEGEFTAFVTPDVDANVVGALVRLDGVCDALANERRQLTGIRLLVPSVEYVHVVEPAPVDPFATPRDSIGNLLRYNPTTPFNHRVQVTGTVLLQIPGQLVYAQDGSDALTVLSEATESFQPGDEVAIVGVPGRESGRLIMRDSVLRRIGQGTVPSPIVLPDHAAADLKYDGRLVTVDGTLLSAEPTADGVLYQLQHPHAIFSAQLQVKPVQSANLSSGTRLRLTGVYRVELDEYRRPRGFVVNLRSPADIVVLARPSWWTAARVFWVATALLTLAVLAAVWGIVLTRKNDQLERARRQLQRANEELEIRVAERTRDLTQEIVHRRESEHALASERLLLRTLIDNLPAYLYVKDSDGRFMIGNLPHARLLGAATAADVIGRTERDFWPAEIAREYEETDRMVMTTGEPLILHEEPYHIGEKRGWHSTTKVPLKATNGRVTGLIAILVDVTDRREIQADRETLHRQLLETSRRAGMAEVATGVLHNIGNVLNSVNVSAGVAMDIVTRSRSEKLGIVVDLLEKHRGDLAAFFAQDSRAQRIPDYLAALAEQLRSEQSDIGRELASLQSNIDHIKQVVAMQQTYAKISGVTERVEVREIVEDALRINAEGLKRHRVEIVRELRANPTIVVERHKVLQILVNLISNAKYACDDALQSGRRVTITVDQVDGAVTIAVKDNGVGIRAENLTRIFSHGFTTRKNGHGFGLHSGAIAARELGGTLRVASDGPGHGATFTLELPVTGPVAA